MILIYGISGKAGSGKDTLAEYLIGKLKDEGKSAYRIAFADPLKELATEYFPFCDVKRKDPITRSTLQGLGQLMREEVESDFWVNKALRKVDFLSRKSVDSYFFITDVRYRNETSALQKIGLEENYKTTLIRLEGRTTLEGDSMAHSSEVDLDGFFGFDMIYRNDLGLEDLYTFGDKVLGEIH